MGTVATKLTVAEFEQMPEPDQPGKQELLQGELIQLQPARAPHSRIAQALSKLLGNDRALVEAGYQMSGDTWLVPDVSIPWPDQREENEYFQGSPMIAVEIVSPGNAAEEIARKTDAYLTYGAAEVWIIYPRARYMMVHKSTAIEKITDAYACKTISVTVRISEILANAA